MSQIYLASKSPRRRELLKSAHIPFEVIDVDVEEVYPAELPVQEIAQYLAELKATGAIDLIKKEDILITADTIVVFDNEVIGKPIDRADAIQTIRKLSGQKHMVITGVTIVVAGQMNSFSSFSKVTLHQLTDKEIEFYVDAYAPFDKAGSYGIQDWIGWVKIKSIEGSYANVMGLPVDDIYDRLNPHFKLI